MWISYLGVFICVLSAYDVYKEKNAVLFTSPIILLMEADICTQTYNFIKKETLAQVFSCEFCEFSKNTFLQHTSARLLLVSVFSVEEPKPVINLVNNFIRIW